MTASNEELLALADAERKLCALADAAYFKAGETSDPQHWLEAALLARQHRNALTAHLAAQSGGEVPSGLYSEYTPVTVRSSTAPASVAAMKEACKSAVKDVIASRDDLGYTHYVEFAAAIDKIDVAASAPSDAVREALERVVKFDECRTPEPMLREMVVSYYSNHLLDQAFAYHCADRFIAALTASEGNAAPGQRLRLCGYCKTWNSKPCGEQCHLRPDDPSWEDAAPGQSAAAPSSNATT